MTPISPELRPCRIEPLGVYLPYPIVNIVLMNVRPGFEKVVIDHIDNRLSIYRKHLARMEYACKERLSTDFSTEAQMQEVNQYVALWEEQHQSSLLSRAVHATLLGDYQLATVFTSIDYGQKSNLEALDYVMAHRTIPGSVPISCLSFDSPDFHYLRQRNPDEFLRPFNHTEGFFEPAPAEVRKQPLLTICQLQTAGLIRTTNAANILLPLLYAIEAKLREAMRSKDPAASCDPNKEMEDTPSVEALLVCSSEWNDYTLLLRSSDLNDAVHCIASVVSITLADLMTQWSSLEKNPSYSEEMLDPVVLQRGKFNDRFCRLIQCLGDDQEHLPKDANTKNHVFSASTTISGVLWPFAQDAIEVVRAQLAGKSKPLRRALSTFDGWSIRGSVRGRVYIANQAGRDLEISGEISNILKDLHEDDFPGHHGGTAIDAWKAKIPRFNKFWCLLGYYDKVVPGSFLVPPPEIPCDNLSYLIARVYYLRWVLLKKPLSNLMDKTKMKTILIPWFGDHVPAVPGDSSSLRGIRVEIQGQVRARPVTTSPPDVFHTTWHLQRFIQASFGIGDCELPRHKNMMALKSRHLSRHLLATCLQVFSRLQNALSDPQESVQALELADAYITWLNAILTALNNKSSTTKEIDGLTRAFTGPFRQALNQRAFVGFHMTENTDFTTDLTGGAHKNLTAIDGLMKGVLSLIGPPFRVGGLTVVGHGPSAEIKISTVYDENASSSFSPDAEITYAVCTVNYVHLVHPMMMSVVLHEMLHTVQGSMGFRNALRECGKSGEELADWPNTAQTDPKDRLDRARFTEILVEYLLAWLVFLPLKEGEPCLYAQTFLMHLMLNIEGYGNTERGNRLIVAEHILRCFLVDQVLTAEVSHRAGCLNDLEIKKTFADWWSKNCSFVVDKGTQIERKYTDVLTKMIEQWSGDEALEPRLCAIRKATTDYFTETAAGYEDSTRSKQCRVEFLKNLREAQEIHTDAVKTALFKDPPEPVNFVLDDLVNVDGELPKRSLRVRRLESLVSNLVLIRAFYSVLCDLLPPEFPGSLHLHRIGQHIDFSKNDGRRIMFDQMGGALFTVGLTAHMQNIRLGQAFFLSMWHITEVMKLPGIVSLRQLADELKKQGEHPFVFNKPLYAHDFPFLY